MKNVMIVLFTGLFVMSVGAVSFAGMLDKAVEATENVNSMVNDAKAKTDSVEQKSIEAQNASQQGSENMVDQAKETVKETVNEQIDNIGK